MSPHRTQQPGWGGVSTAWRDGIFPEHMADPDQAYQDAKEAHIWITARLATVPPGSIREFVLTQERKRLADIWWRLARVLGRK